MVVCDTRDLRRSCLGWKRCIIHEKLEQPVISEYVRPRRSMRYMEEISQAYTNTWWKKCSSGGLHCRAKPKGCIGGSRRNYGSSLSAQESNTERDQTSTLPLNQRGLVILIKRRWRLPSIEPTVGQCLVFQSWEDHGERKFAFGWRLQLTISAKCWSTPIASPLLCLGRDWSLCPNRSGSRIHHPQH